MTNIVNKKVRSNNARRVTIAIPTFNRLGLLRRAVDSVLMQGYEDFEIIISDNASTDGTQDYLSTLCDSRIKVLINSQNLGMVANWQQCLSSATGEYFLLMSDDDAFLDENAISKFAAFFYLNQEKEFGVIFSDVKLERVHNNNLERICTNQRIYSAPQLIQEFFENKILIYPCVTFFRTQDLIDIGGYSSFDAKLAVDACAWMSIALRYGNCGWVSEPLSLYRIHQSLSTSHVNAWNEDFIALRNIIEFHKEKLTHKQYVRILKSLLSAWNRMPLGYIIQKYRYDKSYSLISIIRDAILWRRRLFALSNIIFAFNKFVTKLK